MKTTAIVMLCALLFALDVEVVAAEKHVCKYNHSMAVCVARSAEGLNRSGAAEKERHALVLADKWATVVRQRQESGATYAEPESAAVVEAAQSGMSQRSTAKGNAVQGRRGALARRQRRRTNSAQGSAKESCGTVGGARNRHGQQCRCRL